MVKCLPDPTPKPSSSASLSLRHLKKKNSIGHMQHRTTPAYINHAHHGHHTSVPPMLTTSLSLVVPWDETTSPLESSQITRKPRLSRSKSLSTESSCSKKNERTTWGWETNEQASQENTKRWSSVTTAECCVERSSCSYICCYLLQTTVLSHCVFPPVGYAQQVWYVIHRSHAVHSYEAHTNITQNSTLQREAHVRATPAAVHDCFANRR